LTLTTGDAAARAANTEAMLAYMDAPRRTPGKFTTQPQAKQRVQGPQGMNKRLYCITLASLLIFKT
jgi:hypothetical protein